MALSADAYALVLCRRVPAPAWEQGAANAVEHAHRVESPRLVHPLAKEAPLRSPLGHGAGAGASAGDATSPAAAAEERELPVLDSSSDVCSSSEDGEQAAAAVAAAAVAAVPALGAAVAALEAAVATTTVAPKRRDACEHEEGAVPEVVADAAGEGGGLQVAAELPSEVRVAAPQQQPPAPQATRAQDEAGLIPPPSTCASLRSDDTGVLAAGWAPVDAVALEALLGGTTAAVVFGWEAAGGLSTPSPRSGHRPRRPAEVASLRRCTSVSLTALCEAASGHVGGGSWQPHKAH